MKIDFSKFRYRLPIYIVVGVIWTFLGMLYVWFGYPHGYESPPLGYLLHYVMIWLSIGGLFVLLFLHFNPLLSFLGFLLSIVLTIIIGEVIHTWLTNPWTQITDKP